MVLENNSRVDFSLQISNLKNVEGMFQSETPFLIKNITSDDIVLTVNMASAEPDEWIETIFAPGWSPEICCGIMAVEPNTIQIGY